VPDPTSPGVVATAILGLLIILVALVRAVKRVIAHQLTAITTTGRSK
jgi:hypothetical protein